MVPNTSSQWKLSKIRELTDALLAGVDRLPFLTVSELFESESMYVLITRVYGFCCLTELELVDGDAELIQ